mgnify:CR=1 FL=1
MKFPSPWKAGVKIDEIVASTLQRRVSYFSLHGINHGDNFPSKMGFFKREREKISIAEKISIWHEKGEKRARARARKMASAKLQGSAGRIASHSSHGQSGAFPEEERGSLFLWSASRRGFVFISRALSRARHVSPCRYPPSSFHRGKSYNSITRLTSNFNTTKRLPMNEAAYTHGEHV